MYQHFYRAWSSTLSNMFIKTIELYMEDIRNVLTDKPVLSYAIERNIRCYFAAKYPLCTRHSLNPAYRHLALFVHISMYLRGCPHPDSIFSVQGKQSCFENMHHHETRCSVTWKLGNSWKRRNTHFAEKLLHKTHNKRSRVYVLKGACIKAPQTEPQYKPVHLQYIANILRCR